MNNFKSGGGRGGFDNKRGGGRNFGSKPRFGGWRDGGGFKGKRDDDRGGRGGGEMFSATCSECHKACEVPFRPSGDKPVYCSACFGKMNKDGGDFRSNDRGDRGQSDYKKPTRSFSEDRPRFGGDNENKGQEILKQKIDALEVKVNKILELLTAKDKPVEIEKTVIETPKKVKVKKSVTKTKK